MKRFLIFFLIIILMGVFNMDILGRSMKDIQDRMTGQVNYRINVVKGVVESENINKTYNCYIAGETVVYPNIPTFSRNPKLQSGDEVTIEFINGCRETPCILAPEDIRERPDTTELVTLKESYLANGATAFLYGYNEVRAGQTFLTTSAHTINYIELLLGRKGNPGTVYIEIKAADASDLPIGPVLTSGNTDGNTLPHYLGTPSREWRRIDLTEYSLLDATKYAITIFSAGGNSTNTVGLWNYIGGDPGGVAYPDGKLIRSLNYGVTWVAINNQDGGFKIYGKEL